MISQFIALPLPFVFCMVLSAPPAPKLAATSTLKGHKGEVWGLTFSPNGKHLASYGPEKGFGVRVWDVASGKNTLTLEGHRERVLDVAFSPDGKTIASASADGTIIFWEIQTGRMAATVKEPKGKLIAKMAFSPDGKTLAFGGGIIEKTLHLWDLDKGKLIATLTDITYGGVVCLFQR